MSLLMPAGSLLYAPVVLTVHLHCLENAPLPLSGLERPIPIYGFGTVLEPRYIVGPKWLDQ